jgi:glutamyl-tRNA reductase
LYCATDEEGAPGAEELVSYLGKSRNTAPEEFRDHLYIRSGADAASHLLTVSSSLDSMVVGESQIIAQIKECFSLAVAIPSTGKVLNRLFHAAFVTSKEIYSNTAIANRRISVAGVAVDLAKQLFADIPSAKVVIIGAGQMGELLVEHFKHIDCKNIIVINRSYQRGVDLAAAHEIAADKWETLDEHLIDADIVVASAGGQDYLFKKDTFKKVMKKRRKGSVLLIDIAVPRNFEPAVNDIENVYLYSVDDLAAVVQKNMKLREEEVDQAVEIICEKTADFMDWFNLREIGPIVGEMKQQFEEIRRNETDRFFAGPRCEADCKDAMESMVNRVVNKLLHCVIKNVNAVAREHGAEKAAKLASDIVHDAKQIAKENRSNGRE